MERGMLNQLELRYQELTIILFIIKLYILLTISMLMITIIVNFTELNLRDAVKDELLGQIIIFRIKNRFIMPSFLLALCNSDSHSLTFSLYQYNTIILMVSMLQNRSNQLIITLFSYQYYSNDFFAQSSCFLLKYYSFLEFQSKKRFFIELINIEIIFFFEMKIKTFSAPQINAKAQIRSDLEQERFQMQFCLFLLILLNLRDLLIIVKLMNTEGLVNQVNLLNSYVRALESEKISLQLENEKLHAQVSKLVQIQEQLVLELNATKDKNQDLLRVVVNQNEELKKIAQFQRLLVEKQRELLEASQQKKRRQGFISKQQGQIQQLMNKMKILEEGFDQQRKDFNQTLQDLKNQKVIQLHSLADQKDKFIAQLTLEIQKKALQLSKSNVELEKQKQKFSEQIKFLSKNIQQLNERYNEAVKTNQNYQSKILVLQKNNSELQTFLSIEKALMNQYKTSNSSLFQKTQAYTIAIKKLESELSQSAKLRSEDNQKFIRQMNKVQQEKEEIRKEKEEIEIKYSQIQNQKSLLAKADSQKMALIQQLQNKNNYANLQLSQLRQQSKRTQEILKQKIKALQQQLLVIENQVNSAKFTAILDHQTKSQKEIELNVLKNIISEQQKCILQQKAAFAKLNDLLSSKEKQIENIQANNSMLRKQVLTALANEDSTRKEMLIQKQNSSALLIKSRGSETNLHQNIRKSSGKRYSMLAQCSTEANFRRSNQQKLTYMESKKTCQSLVEENLAPADENDCQEV